MTVILETNRETYEQITKGEINFVVSKFRRQPEVGDTLAFQEVDDDNAHTGEELKFIINQVETEGCKAAFTAVGFKTKE